MDVAIALGLTGLRAIMHGVNPTVSADHPDDITQLLHEWSRGSEQALPRLVELVYPELHRIASRHLSLERPGHTQALRLYESVPLDDPAWNASPRAYVLVLKRLGAVEMVTGALDASERHYRAALAIEEDVIRRDPGNAQWPFELTYTLSDLGSALKRRGRVDDAVSMWTRALALRRAALAADPKNVRAIVGVASLLNRLGSAYRETTRSAEALAVTREDLHLRDTLLTLQGPLPNRVWEQRWATLNLAGALLELADTRVPEAGAHINEARALFQSLPHGDIETPGHAGSGTGTGIGTDRAFREAYERLSARLGRR